MTIYDEIKIDMEKIKYPRKVRQASSAQMRVKQKAFRRESGKAIKSFILLLLMTGAVLILPFLIAAALLGSTAEFSAILN